MSITIRTNDAQLTNVLIPDLGFFIRTVANGGPETFDDREDLELITRSFDLRDFVVDDAFGVDSSTLILVDPDTGLDVPQDEALEFLDNLTGTTGAVQVNNWFGGWT